MEGSPGWGRLWGGVRGWGLRASMMAQQPHHAAPHSDLCEARVQLVTAHEGLDLVGLGPPVSVQVPHHLDAFIACHQLVQLGPHLYQTLDEDVAGCKTRLARL
jgi:hypothetical protein